MDCDVAREALSARIDGEREPVPGRRVDEHLESCSDCRDWYFRARTATQQLRTLAGQSRPPISAVTEPDRRSPRRWGAAHVSRARWALAAVGVLQASIALMQAVGISVGVPAGTHSAMMAGHLLNESTAWSVALGVVMFLAALRPDLAAGLSAVLVVFTGVLAAYVLADAVSAAVTPLRILSHLPVVAGTVLALLVWRNSRRPAPAPRAGSVAEGDDRIELPDNASRGRRRGHLWPTDGSAA